MKSTQSIIKGPHRCASGPLKILEGRGAGRIDNVFNHGDFPVVLSFGFAVMPPTIWAPQPSLMSASALALLSSTKYVLRRQLLALFIDPENALVAGKFYQVIWSHAQNISNIILGLMPSSTCFARFCLQFLANESLH